MRDNTKPSQLKASTATVQPPSKNINLDELTAILVTMCNVDQEIAVQITEEVSRIADEACRLYSDLTHVTVRMDKDLKNNPSACV